MYHFRKFDKMPRYIKTCEPIDDFLASQGLMRKITAKDGSCLFRAVAEQVFHTQALHNDVRQSCIRFMEQNKEHFEPFVEGPFEQHLAKLQNAKEWAGQVEISALSLMYKRDFIIYQDPGKPPSNVTQNGYSDKVLLCFSNNNHYDSVFTKQYQSSLGVCQSIVYEILYKRVFNIAKEADEAVEILRNSPGKKPQPRHYGYLDGPNAGGDTLNQRSPRRHEDEERDRFGRLRIEKRRPPLPYKVAKALDPDIYRNVEYDCWNEGNKEQMHQDYLLATGLQFCPGDKVQVIVDETKKWYSAHIQEVKPDKGPITVFVEDLGEKHEVPVKNVKPHPSNPPRSWTVVGGRGYKGASSYHQKYSNGVTNGDYRNRSKPPVKWGRGQGMMVLAQPYPPGGEAMGEGQSMPFQIRAQQNGNHKGPKSPSPYGSTTPPPRFMNRGMEGHMETMGRGRAAGYQSGPMMQDNRGGRSGRMYSQGMPGSYPYEGDMSSEEIEDRKAFEENMAIYEVQQDPSSFSTLASNCGLQGGPGANPVQFWSKMRKDGRRSISPQQRMDSPSPHLTDKRGSDPMDSMIPGQFQDIMLSSQDQRGIDIGCVERHYSPVTTIQMDEGMIHPSTSPSMPKSATPSSVSISPSLDPHAGSPPNIAPAGYVPPMAMGLPFYHFFISLTDWNISGNVNFNSQISRDPNGSDLPISDISTSRFFFNLGVEYYRRVCMIQQLQHQQCYQFPSGAGPVPQHQQQQPHPHGTSPAYTHMLPHPSGMGGMTAPPMSKNLYDAGGGGGVTMLNSGGSGGGGGGGGSGGQEEDDQPDGQVSYDGQGGRNFNTQGYMSEPIPIHSTGISQPTSTVYGNMCNMGGETYVPVPYQQSPGMQHPSPIPGNQMGVPSTTHNPYIGYSQQQVPTPMGYTGGKMQPHPTPQSAYSPNNPVTYVQVASPAMSHQQQHHQPLQQQQQPCVAMPTSQGNVAAASNTGGQYSTHSTSVVSNSSCSSQDSGILSCSPPQVPYAATAQ